MHKKTQKKIGARRWVWMATLILGLSIALPNTAMAAAGADTCTDQPIYNVFLEDRLDSVLMDIVNLVRDALAGVMYDLFTGIVASPNYQSAVAAAMSLFIAFYGVSFIFGFVPANFSQGLIRLAKIGVVGAIMLPIGWYYFDQTVVMIFMDGTDWLIDVMIELGGGDPAEGHFDIMEPIMIRVFSPKTFIMIIGSLMTGPFGPIMAMALLWSVFNLFMMILRALEIYLLSLIVRTLLLGMGPIFIALMFFERTKHIFMGWINQLVSFSLQPVLLFAFLAFFVTLLDSAAEELITPVDKEVELCYTKMEHMGKMMFDVQHWRFKVDGVIYEGEWTWQGPVGGAKAPFPIDIIDVLVFLILCHIGTKMSTVVVEIAAEMAQASVRLTDVPNTLSGWFRGAGGGHSTADEAAKRSLHK